MILLSAAACTVNLHVMAVILAGLLVGPAVIVPMLCGIFIYYIFSIVPDYMMEVSTAYLETGVEKFKYIAENALLNKEMYIALAAALIVMVLVYIIKLRSVNHSWKLAVIAGSVINFLIMLSGGIITDASVNIFRLIIGTVISVFASLIVIFFVRDLDYKKIERVQFEDDEYYYYVKAIPKRTVDAKASVKRRTVKEIFDERDA